MGCWYYQILEYVNFTNKNRILPIFQGSAGFRDRADGRFTSGYGWWCKGRGKYGGGLYNWWSNLIKLLKLQNTTSATQADVFNAAFEPSDASPIADCAPRTSDVVAGTIFSTDFEYMGAHPINSYAQLIAVGWAAKQFAPGIKFWPTLSSMSFVPGTMEPRAWTMAHKLQTQTALKHVGLSQHFDWNVDDAGIFVEFLQKNRLIHGAIFQGGQSASEYSRLVSAGAKFAYVEAVGYPGKGATTTPRSCGAGDALNPLIYCASGYEDKKGAWISVCPKNPYELCEKYIGMKLTPRVDQCFQK